MIHRNVTDLLIAAGHGHESIRTECFGARGERDMSAHTSAAGELSNSFAMDLAVAEGGVCTLRWKGHARS